MAFVKIMVVFRFGVLQAFLLFLKMSNNDVGFSEFTLLIFILHLGGFYLNVLEIE